MYYSKLALGAMGIVIALMLGCGGPRNCPGDPLCNECISEMPSEFGILSESIDGLKLDVQGYLGLFDGGGGKFVPNYDEGLVAERQTVKEGESSIKATIEVGPVGEWAGWFIQYGLTSSSSETIDMCAFAGGMLKFWIKAEPEVRNLLVGIRSGDHLPGEEKSKVFLSDYPSFHADNQWHEVSIPIDHLVNSSEGFRTDLTQIKVLFMVASSSNETGGTNGVAAFYIDNIHWLQP